MVKIFTVGREILYVGKYIYIVEYHGKDIYGCKGGILYVGKYIYIYIYI